MRPSPRKTLAQSEAAPSAITLSGMAGASAPKIRLGRKWPMMCLAATGAGWRGFRIDPSGAWTCTGRNEPSLCGTSGEIAALTAKLVYAWV